MKLKTYLLPGVFSLEFLIRPENLAVGGVGGGEDASTAWCSWVEPSTKNMDEFTFCFSGTHVFA